MYKEIYKWIIHEVLPTVLKEMQVLNLDSLLLEPVQRLPRYVSQQKKALPRVVL